MKKMIKNTPILLDTCIINNLLSKEKALASGTSKLLADLVKNKNDLYISEFTYHELLRGASEAKSKKAKEKLKYFNRVLSDEERIERATMLFTAYKNNKNTKCIMSSISDIDIFIGALIFTKQQPLLLTADFNDFPRPFFIERHFELVEYKKNKGGKCSQYYYFLSANLKELVG